MAQITTEAGALFLRPAKQRTGIVCRLARCFRDHGRADLVEHCLGELIKQGVYGIAWAMRI